MHKKTKEVAFTGMLFALAIVLSFVEGMISPMFGLPPGVKLGLANIVVMYALLFLGWKQALLLNILKAFFVAMTRGVTGGLLSLCGGMLSFFIMLVLLWLFKDKISNFMLSVCGAVSHNMGQLLAAFVLLNSTFTLVYAPVLLISGLVMGAITSISLNVMLPALKKVGLTDKHSKRY